MRTAASRYSQRPGGVDGGAVVETGTWRVAGARVILHIEKSSANVNQSARNKPAFADRTFVLSGCELHLVGSAFAFDKQRCSP